MAAPDNILRLIEQFSRNRDAYRSGAYNETQVRVEFIDPLFIELGWDLHNKEGYAEAYKDVVHEDRIHVAGGAKAPDYCFRIGGARKFFVEAKKPSVDIKHGAHPAYQLRRYAWSAKLPLSILTDFEEFAVYDCRVKPSQNDPASKARTAYFKYTQYAEQWDEIYGIFSRDAVLKGSFDKYADSNKRKRGTAEVDNAFLEEIELWRELLARNIALRNKELSQRELNHAVQATIDRVIFLRIAEDRGLENYAQLQALLNGTEVYPRLTQLFRNADDRYNSGLFHFRREPGREQYDNWTLKLAIDDKVLKQICKRLYYPESPYEFAVLPADILGQVYERFLGKVIRLKGKSAVVEEKPEVRKAGGVYYTPTYIVEYIVKHTVGKLLENKTPNQARGKGKNNQPIRILDPACGSGSFLLGAYQYLLDWYLDKYKEKPEKHVKGRNPVIFETAAVPAPGEERPGREYRLTTAERKRILLDHIHGVDIDPQAVEVTKLSLLLKVLEGENIETLNKNMALFHERALPDLSQNIQCGNSLIGPDFYQGKQLEIGEDEIYKINAFDWQKAFPQVFNTQHDSLWFVTFVTHNSRVSERMVQFGVTDRQGKGLQPLVLTPGEQIIVAKTLFDSACRHNYAFVALNVLPDHVHLLMPAATEDELNDRVRTLKIYSAQAINKHRGAPKGTQVWAQKFNRKQPKSHHDATEIAEYILTNHEKHAERWNTKDKGLRQPEDKGLQPLVKPKQRDLAETWDKGLQPLVSRHCVDIDTACIRPAGFHAIIGNPPYIRIQTMKETAPETVPYYKDHYAAAVKGNYDIYVLFVERGLQLLNPTGRLGFILPHKFFNAQYGQALRKLIADGRHLEHVLHFTDEQVFDGATTYTCLMFLHKSPVQQVDYTKITDLEQWRATGQAEEDSVPIERFTPKEWNITIGRGAELTQRLSEMSVKLGGVSNRIYQGPITSADTVFLFKDWKRSKDNSVEVVSKELQESISLEAEILRPVVRSGNVGRYWAHHTAYVLFPYAVDNFKARLLAQDEFQAKYPQAWSYLKRNQKVLESREKGKFKDSEWYRYGRTQNLGLWEQPKILIPYMITNLSAYPDFANHYYFINVTTGGYGLTISHPEISQNYLCGLLNSRLLDYLLKAVSTTFRGGYFAANKQYIEQLPIRTIKFNNPKDKARHDQIVSLVERMLDLHQRLETAKTTHHRTTLQRQIDTTDTEIDHLVYELYGLTQEEIQIVEESTA